MKKWGDFLARRRRARQPQDPSFTFLKKAIKAKCLFSRKIFENKLIRKIPVLLVDLRVRVQLLRRLLEVLLDGGEEVPLGGGAGLARIPD